MKRIAPLFTVIALFAFTFVANAQDICSAIVQQALVLTDEQCAPTGRNQACHGYLQVNAEPRAEVVNFAFNLGDIAPLADIQSLTTSALNAETGTWGVAVLKAQADLPDTLPGENVTFLLFGDTQLDDVGGAAPMHAFRLRTGLTGTRCAALPPDGLLIQTPHGYGRINLQVNGVDVSLGSTVFLEAQADGFLTISTLEGSARVTTNGITRVAFPTQALRVPMDGNLQLTGNVGAPQPYDDDAMARLPLTLLERAIVLNTPIAAPAVTLDTPISGGSGDGGDDDGDDSDSD
jgi:hypothetical protein